MPTRLERIFNYHPKPHCGLIVLERDAVSGSVNFGLSAADDYPNEYPQPPYCLQRDHKIWIPH